HGAGEEMVIVAAHPPVKLDCPGSGVYKKQPMDPQQPFQGCDIMPLVCCSL
ncbi:hypothetical protein JI435_020350, partial [Parastagonospora nodorum SN15]